MNATRGARIALAVLVALLAGCGGRSGPSTDIPTDLVGTYTTMLDEGDLPKPVPRAFVDGGLKWKMSIATSGGADGGSVLELHSTETGDLEGPNLRLDGDKLLLQDEECEQKAGYVFHDNQYSWKLDGSTLTLKTVENECPDRIAETILTSRPWTKE